MSAKDTDTREWSDPKDYGLPFVEITPLKSPPDSFKTKTEAREEAAISSKIKTEKPTKESISVDEVKPKVEAAKAVSKSQEKPKSNAWAWVVVLLAVVILGVISWQLQMNSSKEVQGEVLAEKLEENAAVQKSVPPSASTQTEVSPSPVNQDSITSINNSNPNLSKPAETGTTIANTVSGNLIRIESKAEKVRYFIVVSSLPNEQLASEIAAKFTGKSPEVYLISPYESSPNFRVAIGKFDTWKAAADEVARIKSQYSEDLWILNY
ncbi:SPOR domain-containing protein [Algoriphagus aquatilis]|uniref:SPOR domain-containing protein n=1 Tax=Algoriphagus aquatilis TaxID=490186 RepID=A0ABW0BU31_9BACT